ncbi:MAG: hypothetical protein HY744_12955 [Deltaproteobacteria bacterium]|nr:hypothetical protein [Deltaproteobacteria bacterium]
MRPDRPPTREGVLKQEPLAHLLVHALAQRLASSLFFEEEGGTQHVVQLRAGLATRVHTPDGYALLGAVLVDAGAVGQEDVASALGQDRLLGEALVAAGLVDEKIVQQALVAQLLARMTRLFALPPTTKYAFFDGHDAFADVRGEPPRVDPLRVLWAGLKEHAERSARMPAVLRRIGDRPFSIRPGANLSRFGFAGEALAVVESLLAKGASRPVLVGRGLAPPALCERVVYALAITRHLELGAGAEAANGAAADAEAEPAAGLAEPAAAGAAAAENGLDDSLPAPSAPSAAAEQPERSTPVPAGTDQQQEGSGAAVDVEPESTKALARIALRRVTVRRGSGVPKPQGVTNLFAGATPGEEVAAGGERAARAGVAEPEAEASRWDPLRERIRSLSEQSPLEVLGLGAEAWAERDDAGRAEALWQAYAKAAAEWRPDALAPELADLRAGVVRLQAACARAFEALSAPEGADVVVPQAPQAAAEAAAAPAGGEAGFDEPGPTAADHHDLAWMHFNAQRLTEAVRFCEKARTAAPGSKDYAASAIWMWSMMPDVDVKALLRELDDMLRSGEHVPARFYRGMLHQRLGHDAEARGDFEVVLAHDPEHAQAKQRLALLADAGPAPGSGERPVPAEPAAPKQVASVEFSPRTARLGLQRGTAAGRCRSRLPAPFAQAYWFHP